MPLNGITTLMITNSEGQVETHLTHSLSQDNSIHSKACFFIVLDWRLAYLINHLILQIVLE